VPPSAELLDACWSQIGEATAPQRVRLLLSESDGIRVQSTPVAVGAHFPFDLESVPKLVCMDLQPSVHSADQLLRHKSLWRSAYDQARQRVLGEGSDLFDVIMYNEKEEVTETTIANIAVETESGDWLTPPLSCGLLPGVQRASLLSSGELREGVITVAQLVAAAASGRRLICMNSVRGAYLVRLANERHQGLRPAVGC